MRKVLFALACWATVGLASSRADVTYRYVTDAANYTGAVGATIPISIFLQETVTGASKSIIFTDGGLFGAGVMVNSPGGAIVGTAGDFKITGNQAFSPAGFGNSTGTAGATALDQTPFTATKSGLIINADIPGTTAPGPKVAAPGTAGVNQILLGTLNVKVLAAPTTLTVTPYGGASNTITQTGTDLDFGTQALNGYTGAAVNPLGNFAFTVGAVIPEPSSMALCGLVASGMSYFGYRRRKTTVAESATVA